MNTLRTFIAGAALAVAAASLGGCDKFLDFQPTGVVTSTDLDTGDNLEGMVTATYASLGDDHWTAPYTSMWPYGDIRSGDSYKGGGGTGDVVEYNDFEQFVFNSPTNARVDGTWFVLYVGIGRANDALRRLNAVDAAAFPQRTVRQAEVRFLRGHFYFLLKELFNRVPWIDENLPLDQYSSLSNVELSSDSLWGNIAADFAFAAANLPVTQTDAGRVNRYAAMAYLAKVNLYRAYKQDDNHHVTGIDQALLEKVVQYTDSVIGSTQYGLTNDFAENFLFETENNREAVFKVIMSQSDGTPHGRVDMGNGLNYSMAPGYGCCWFHIPSQNLINAFETDADGLPRFATFNNTSLLDSLDYWTNTVDPRIDHTVGIVGHPFKYKTDFIFQPSWTRVPQTYGLHTSMKELQRPDCTCLVQVGPFWASSKDVDIIRYADVLLWRAEALIELGRQSEALPIINAIRTRAANSTGRLKYANGAAISNYKIGTYSAAGWTQDYARQALRFERRLEFAMEGIRFFDLVRWGIADQTLNDYFAVEKVRHDYLTEAHFTAGRDEYLPIPANQINFTRGAYTQNPGY